MRKCIEKQRLDRFLANAHVGTRSEVKHLIRAGLVTVNSQVIKDPSYKVSEDDKIEVEGKVVEAHRKVYIMLNKPAGYVSTTSDLERTVLALIDHPYARELHIAGRLDKDVEGLLILTNDGDFTHRIISPKKHVEKEYIIETEKPVIISEKMRQKLEKGLKLKDGTVLLPAKIRQVDDFTISITVHEGKYHQIKRMCEALGILWKKIRRIRIGRLTIGDLKLGEWRELTEEDVKKLFEKSSDEDSLD